MDNLSGQVIKGYELREQIGVGGYGAVYRATQPVVGREVAIKIILPQYANHPDFIRRFEAEAHLVARLEHPHIVPLYDYWREPHSAYLVMRWLRGGSLHNRLTGQPWPATEIAPLLEQVAAALTIAHRHGVVHRDLKPANILLDEDSNAYLADFGIAKDLGSIYKTDHNGVIGSPAYISPEQIKNEPITPQTDIYSLGIMLYEILTGTLPFEGPTPIVMLFKHVHEQMPRLQTLRPDLSDALNAVIQRATAKHPAERYPDVIGMVVDLRRAIGSAAPTLERSLGTTAPATVPRGSGNEQRTTGTRRTGSVYDTGVIYHTALLDAVVPAVENPYKGLRAFQEADATDFFGREALTGRLLGRMAEKTDLARFLAVVGPSGSGKSSVVRAGLIPALRRGALPGSRRWFITEMIPGANPLQELETALLRVAVDQPANLLEQLQQDQDGLLYAVQQLLPGGAETELVLLIDQFEEVFTLVEDEAARTHFLNSLLAAVTDPRSRLWVIMTLRADFYDRPLLYTGLSELLRQRTEVVTPLAPEELQHAITGPAERVGMTLEPDLIAAILHDVDEQPGALPLLQYALTELFERRVGHILTLDAYYASGGVLGALARRADEIYDGLDVHEQEVARQLFLRLVTLGEGMEDTRRRVQRTELVALTNGRPERREPKTRNLERDSNSKPAADDTSAIDAVIEVYSRYRLLSFDRDPITRGATIEVAHEALIRTWNRLRDWLDISRDDLRQQRRVAAAAAEWVNAERDPSFLATGVRLAQFATWATETHLALNAAERAYLEASIAQRDAQQAQEQMRKAHEVALERRSRNVLRALVGVLLVATVIAIGLMGVAFNQRQEAQRNAENARQQETLAIHNADEAKRNADEAQNIALFAGAQAALYKGNPDQALTLAVEANSTAQPLLRAQSILAEAAYAPGTKLRMSGHAAAVGSVAFSPDGRTALSGSNDNTAILWDLATGKPIQILKGHTGAVHQVVFSPDGRMALSASADKTLILWDLGTGKAIRTFTGHTDEVASVAISRDGHMALSGSTDKTLILWDVATGTRIRTLPGHPQEVKYVAFSPDDKQALSASQDLTLFLWDVSTGTHIRTFEGHKNVVRSVAWSHDGTMAASTSNDQTIILWDIATGTAKNILRGHTRNVTSVAFSPDDRTILSGSQDSKLGLWDVKTGALIAFLTGAGGPVHGVAFSPDGHAALSGSGDSMVRLWDLDSHAEVQRFVNNGGHDVKFSPDGRMVLSGLGKPNLLTLWDVATGRIIHQFPQGHSGAVQAVAFSPDGKQVLSGSQDTYLILWDIATEQFVRRFDAHTDLVSAVAFSPDGRMAISASSDKTLILWDVNTGKPIRTFKGHTGPVASVAFSPDGKTVVSGAGDKKVILWDVNTATEIHRFENHTGRIFSVTFSPDGSKILSSATDKTMILWDASTGKPIRTFPVQAAAIQAVAFSPDGTQAISGLDDNSVILWDLASGEVIRTFMGHTAPVRAVAFSPDGRTAISASADDSMRLWRIESRDELLAWTKANRYIPPLTCEDKALYQLESVCDAASANATSKP